jgi:hypothetical protein
VKSTIMKIVDYIFHKLLINWDATELQYLVFAMSKYFLIYPRANLICYCVDGVTTTISLILSTSSWASLPWTLGLDQIRGLVLEQNDGVVGDGERSPLSPYK